MTKSELRDSMQKMRSDCPPALRKEWSRQIAARVLLMPEVKKAKKIFLYASFRSEADTDFLLQTFLNEKKTVAFPRVETCKDCARKEAMEFYRVKSYSELTKGYQNIAEPTAKIKVNPKDAVIFVPGLAFDRSGNRLGYGGGFYDDYLTKNSGFLPVTIALAFDFQLLDALPAEATDVRMDFVATEKQVCAFA